ncbi:MAG: hypothetical protein C0P75_003365 [Bacilli bacterium]|jgi:membrane-bound ClpP family serine protease|uniref:hypothetical protein n=1 Tax=unclassified Ureibacillus TaxID=2638520 RepID=UPI0031586D3F
MKPINFKNPHVASYLLIGVVFFMIGFTKGILFFLLGAIFILLGIRQNARLS